MNLIEISKNVRCIRKAQNMTVETLAKKSSFSKGFISQIENFRITPSLKALIRIADALGTSVEFLFGSNSSPQKNYSFGKLVEGEPFDRDSGAEYGINYLALAYQQIGRKMDPFMIEYLPGPEREFMMHENEEFFVLLEGELDFCIYDDSSKRRMRPGDTVYMQANVPHRVILPASCPRAAALAIYC